MAAKFVASPFSSSVDSNNLYQPSPRWGHYATSVGDRVYLCFGHTEHFKDERRELSSQVEVYDPYSETWAQRRTTGTPPPGLCLGTCTSINDKLYTYGGRDGSGLFTGTLSQFDLSTMEWKLLSSDSGPMKKYKGGMAQFGQDKLVLYGGWGIPTSPTRPGASFVRDTSYTDGRGWSNCNEFHVFNINDGVWSSPDMTGPRPPPCQSFSFTSVSENRAVVFGGNQPGRGCVNDLYIIDFTTMHWTKIEQGVGEPWPEGRSGHVACCLDHGGEHPQILITGGVNNDNKALNDMWILDVSSRKWKKLTLPDVTLQPRTWHSTTAMTLTYGLVEVIMFGGCPEVPKNAKTADNWPKISETIIMRFESIERPSSNGGPSTREWVLVDVATNSQRGTSERLREKMMKIITKSKEMVNRRENVPSTSHTSTPESASLRETVQALREEKRVLEQRVEEAQRQAHEEQQLRQQAETTVQSLLFSSGGVQEAVDHFFTQAESQALHHSDHEINQPDSVEDGEYLQGSIEVSALSTLHRPIKTLHRNLKHRSAEQDYVTIRADNLWPDMAEVTMYQAQSHAIETQNKAIKSKEKASTEVQTALEYSDFYGERLDDASNTHRVQQLTENLISSLPQVPSIKAGVAMEIRGVEMCAETSLIMTNSSQHFYWRGYGLILHIPDGCLPADVDQCVVNIYVSIAGQYEFPEGSHLVSAVYWFRCEPSCKFTKAISVEIEHCAPLENSSNCKLSIVRSHCSQKQRPYTFEKVGGVFAEHSSYAYIELDSFSGYSVTQDNSEEREYCATLFYLKRKKSLFEIFFVIVWNTETHLKIVHTYYKSMEATKGSDIMVSFESDSITLDIPPEGITVQGWKIEALTPPVVAKKQVDTFKPKRRIPCCHILAAFSRKGGAVYMSDLPVSNLEGIPLLICKVALKGATKPFNYLTITNSLIQATFQGQGFLKPIMSELEQLGTASEHDKPPLKLLLKELFRVAFMWEDIGIFLEIDERLLKNIKSEEHRVQGCLREMLRLWLSRDSPPPTWSEIISAIKFLGDEKLALELCEKYASPANSTR